jgi:hypothetical protein
MMSFTGNLRLKQLEDLRSWSQRKERDVKEKRKRWQVETPSVGVYFNNQFNQQFPSVCTGIQSEASVTDKRAQVEDSHSNPNILESYCKAQVKLYIEVSSETISYKPF